MTFIPVVMRELRAEARHPANYWVRVACGVVFAALFGLVMSADEGTQAQHGARLFSSLNAALFLSILLVVPLLAANCISRERREGTLGLLFLTPLTAQGIVVGKVACHALRAFSLFLVALPVLAVSVLLGGTDWHDLAMAGLLDLTMLVVALSAALVASSFCRDWTRAMLLALALTLIASFVLFSVHWLVTTWLIYGHPTRLRGRVWWADDPWGNAWRQFQDMSFFQRMEALYAYATGWFSGGSRYMGYNTSWQDMRRYVAPLFLDVWLSWAVSFFFGTVCLLLASIRFAAWRIKFAWQEAPPPLWQQRAARTFTAARYMRSRLRRSLSGLLERNPIGWLQQRTWSARMIKWSWCLVVVLFECAIMAEFQSNIFSQGWLVNGQYVLGGLLLASMAFSAASSFREEVETGALELLLVTPLSPRQLIIGRVRGIWGQFFPALLLLAMGWGWLAYDLQDYLTRYLRLEIELWTTHIPLALLCSFATLPGIGLYFSLRKIHFFNAWALAFVFGILVPAAFASMTLSWMLTTLRIHAVVSGFYDPNIGALVSFAGVQLILFLVSVWLLQRNLTRRTFILNRA